MAAPWSHSWTQKTIMSPRVRQVEVILRNNHVLHKPNMFKFYVIITFAYEFKLECFQLRNCSFLRNLSNDRLQVYIKMNKRWLWLKHMFHHGIWAFSIGNSIHVHGVKLFQGCPGEQLCAQCNTCVQILCNHYFCI